MKHFATSVNPVFQRIALKNFSHFTLHLHASFSEGGNYSRALRTPQALFCSWVNIAV
ncbi:hypothetical protein [Janthinobacterium sp. SUN120]|uniref:hypothetical protein n=1 Tax=Janthinobacterium sp. SUN120 TaxID=3004099 RepID=UPI0025AF3C77|nr:hypothetical protein [Janthinobacterium sp. SUN120]MDN2718377.1 hypothetical protein [Janthinobacterium sp. SUN120]